MKKLSCAVLCLGLLMGCSKSEIDSLKDLKLSNAIESIDTKSLNDVLDVNTLVIDYSGTQIESKDGKYIFSNYTKSKNQDEYTCFYIKSGDNTYTNYLAKVDSSNSDQYIISHKNDIDIDISTNKKWVNDTSDTQLNDEILVDNLKNKEIYNEFVNDTNWDFNKIQDELHKLNKKYKNDSNHYKEFNSTSTDDKTPIKELKDIGYTYLSNDYIYIEKTETIDNYNTTVTYIFDLTNKEYIEDDGEFKFKYNWYENIGYGPLASYDFNSKKIISIYDNVDLKETIKRQILLKSNFEKELKSANLSIDNLNI